MKLICILLALICLCAGCSNKHANKNAQQKDKIASGRISNERLLPETGAQHIRPPKELKAPAPKMLKGQEAPKTLQGQEAPIALMPKKSEEPKVLVSNSGNF